VADTITTVTTQAGQSILIIPSGIPLAVASGGTGHGTWPAYSILMGDGQTIAAITPGPAGTVWTSNGPTAMPSFKVPTGGTGMVGAVATMPLTPTGLGTETAEIITPTGPMAQINANCHIDKESGSFAVLGVDQNGSVWWSGKTQGTMTLSAPAAGGLWLPGMTLQVKMLSGCAALAVEVGGTVLAMLTANTGPLAAHYEIETDGSTFVVSN
jgi:hypothetical protein